MKKSVFAVFLLAVCAVLCLCSAGCNGKQKTSQGLSFTLNADGESYCLAGLGACTDSDIVIPATHEGKPVTSIDACAFEDCEGLISIEIPSSVTSIGESAFYNCGNLTNIKIPSSVTSIGEEAFDGCSSLTYNEYDNGYYLGNESNPYVVLMQAKDASIITCDIHTSTKFIYDSAFRNCSKLRSIEIPNSVTSIGYDAFTGCYGLTSVIIGDSVPSIGYAAFYGCYGLASITIGESVTSIGDYAFADCSGLTSITFQGTKAQWNAISKGSKWNSFTGNYTIHCTDGDISK